MSDFGDPAAPVDWEAGDLADFVQADMWAEAYTFGWLSVRPGDDRNAVYAAQFARCHAAMVAPLATPAGADDETCEPDRSYAFSCGVRDARS